MALQLSASGANFAVDGLCNTVATSPVDSGGSLRFHTASDNEVADCPFNTNAFAAASGGTAAMSTGTAVSDTNTTAGTIDHAHIIDNDTTTILAECTVGVGSGDIQFSSLTFGTGETLTVTSFSITFTNSTLT